MTAAAFGMVLLAAVLHAGWNLLVKASDDRLVTGWSQAAFGALVFSPVLVVTGVPWEAWESIAASSLIHTGYALALIGAYDRADLSLVYPVARGTAPSVVAVGALILLSDNPGWIGFAAIALIVSGVIAIGLGGHRPGIAWALLTAAFIATYTLVDGAAVRNLDAALPYTISVFWGNTILFTPIVIARRGLPRIMATVRAAPLQNALAGAASAGAYGLVLAAARFAPLGLVSAVRETSVILGALGGWLLLGEPFGKRRVAASVTIAAGLILAAMSG